MAEQQTIAALTNDLENFLRAFKDRGRKYKYFDKINHMMASNLVSLTIDYIDFDSFSPELAKQITHNPDEMFEAFSGAGTCQFSKKYILITKRRFETRLE